MDRGAWRATVHVSMAQQRFIFKVGGKSILYWKILTMFYNLMFLYVYCFSSPTNVSSSTQRDCMCMWVCVCVCVCLCVCV